MEAKEYWSGWPIPSPADLSSPGIELGSPALQADSLPTELSRKPIYYALAFILLKFLLSAELFTNSLSASRVEESLSSAALRLLCRTRSSSCNTTGTQKHLSSKGWKSCLSLYF